MIPSRPPRPPAPPDDMRNPSIDSTLSTNSSNSLLVQKLENGTVQSGSKSGPETNDVASLIRAAGSAEAAISKLAHEKQQAASHNAQLWRLVEKQRAMILGLNKDLEKSLKEKEKYRRKFKEHLVQSASGSSLIAQDIESSMVSNASNSPTGGTYSSASPPSNEQNEASIVRLPASNVSSPTDSTRRVGTPQANSKQMTSETSFPPSPNSQLDIGRNDSNQPTMMTDGVQKLPTSPQSRLYNARDSESSRNHQSFSSPKQASNRKAPPAPLQLSPQPYVANFVAHSDSEYEDDVASARAEQMTRGRRKTREEDDRDRELAAMREVEDRSRSKKTPRSRSVPANENRDGENAQQKPGVIPASNSSIRQLKQQHIAPVLLSPGLPMSPRPGDRPMNSPMPRAPNQTLNTIPMSPKMGLMGLPLSPRAPRHPIPLPTQHNLPASSSRLRGEPLDQRLPADSPATNNMGQSLEPSPQSDIYKGFVVEQYPDLLLPPHALSSIFIQTASSRLRPSRQSYLFPKGADDSNPVLTLAVCMRSDLRQIWRVEKTLAALSTFDTQVKVASSFRARFPDKALFVGHAPAKIDARRSAIDAYFEQLMQSITEDKAALILGKFMSTDVIAPDLGNELDTSSPTELRSDTPIAKSRQQRAGYLTKRGKNFGGWKARYFVLDGPSLRYFEAPGGAHLGSIKLQNAQIGKQSPNSSVVSLEDEDSQFRHAFLILEPKKKDSTTLVRHVLCAESDHERDAWVDALLQYVDFRDDEDDHHKVMSGIKHDVTGPRSHKSTTDLKTSAAKDDFVVAVSYNETVAGDAPVIGPSSAHKLDGPTSSSDDTAAPHFNISAPTNLTVIQNAGEWGMKVPLTPSSKEFSKDKKRGMFSAFMGRPSLDLPSEKHSHSGTAPTEFSGRPIFGMPLAEAVDHIQPATGSTGLPIVVYRCLDFMTAKKATQEEGIFRLSGSNTVIKAIKDRFNNDGDVDLLADDESYDIHAVASLLKLYLRELPASILTRELHIEFLHCLEMQPDEKLQTLHRLVGQLPQSNRTLLHALAIFLLAIVNNADVNKMNRRNVGIVFAPTLNVPAPLILAFVEDHEVIFAPPSDDIGFVPQNIRTAESPDSTDLRSPRRQMFSELPTPAHNQTTFRTFETGMVPMQAFRHPQDTNFNARHKHRESGMMLLQPRKQPSWSRLHDEEISKF